VLEVRAMNTHPDHGDHAMKRTAATILATLAMPEPPSSH
jgi:hypothetical protein